MTGRHIANTSLRPQSSDCNSPPPNTQLMGHLPKAGECIDRRILVNLEPKLVHKNAVPRRRSLTRDSNDVQPRTGFNPLVAAPPSRGSQGELPFRSDEERLTGPDRLNLDCRGLRACVNLVGEERLRLLNYQNNEITTISHLNNLRCLVFLDLYNNQIEKIENLDCLTRLRVLMIGKNRISKVENLDKLVSLEVRCMHRIGGTHAPCRCSICTRIAYRGSRASHTSTS